MAKGIKLPPKANLKKKLEKITKSSPKIQPKPTLEKGKSKNFVAMAKESRKPKPSQNERGKTPDGGGSDLTR